MKRITLEELWEGGVDSKEQLILASEFDALKERALSKLNAFEWLSNKDCSDIFRAIFEEEA